ncbi:C4-dicarboxylate TRAP transporter large permease protein DctM [Roseobacter fucihabitans]|uniref:TRAP transporter large permease protein n=1 Tax=Roseobacter fucihabitans TaxID=1537242 RepID=A0ABZ2BVZ8_9RHOB|nr:TRAP transporter large permease [Roseobacter litoralis]MBC6967228.1 Sialic acid TRAP transporter permease protein SiaT [Roseobacter litoralis]
MIILGALFLICLLLLIGVSVPMSFGGVLIFISIFGGHDVSGFMPTGHWKVSSLVLLAIPLFILAGAIMERGRIAAPLVALAELMVGHVRGGLSAAAVVASGIFGAISGSAAATLTCIGSIMMPHLRRANYPDGLSASLIVSASPLGLLIPPSSSQILYAWVAQQSVLKCFLSTVVPGLILITLLCLVNFVLLRNVTDLKVRTDHSDFVPELRKRSVAAIPALMMPVIILGGIYGGIMTPTEAAGVAVVYAIPVGFFVYKGLTRENFFETLRYAGTTIGVVMMMVFMVLIVSQFLVYENIPALAQNLIYSISEHPVIVLLMVNLVMILIGMLMDDISGLLLSAPLLLPIVQSAGMDPVHFAAVLGVNLGMANITPPTAPLLYLGARVTETPVNVMLKPTLLLIVFAWLPTLLITTFVPQVSLWLPNLVFG